MRFFGRRRRTMRRRFGMELTNRYATAASTAGASTAAAPAVVPPTQALLPAPMPPVVERKSLPFEISTEEIAEVEAVAIPDSPGPALPEAPAVVAEPVVIQESIRIRTS